MRGRGAPRGRWCVEGWVRAVGRLFVREYVWTCGPARCAGIQGCERGCVREWRNAAVVACWRAGGFLRAGMRGCVRVWMRDGLASGRACLCVRMYNK